MSNTYKPNDVDRKPWIVFTGDDDHLLDGECIKDKTITGDKIADNTIGPEKLDHVTNVFQDGYYPEMTVGTAESLVGEDKTVTFAVRTVDSPNGVAKISTIKGNTYVFNQLVDDDTETVTGVNGNKYLTRISDVASIITSDGSAISVTGGEDNVIDLTHMFGAGNEPATVAEFESMFPESYYPYDAGSLKSVDITGIATEDSGGNALDERSIPVSTYFPTGMKSAGTVHDELTESAAVTRVGAVDLGTLDWETGSTDTTGVYKMSTASIASQIKTPALNSDYGNIKCAKYDTSNVQYTATRNVGICVTTTGRVQVYDSNYNTSSSPASFKTAMSGVYLFYELATPTTQTIDPPLNLRYRVAEGGTEEITTQSGVVSAPPTFDTAYPLDMRKEYISKDSFDNFCTALGTAISKTITATYNSTTEEYEYTIS